MELRSWRRPPCCSPDPAPGRASKKKIPSSPEIRPSGCFRPYRSRSRRRTRPTECFCFDISFVDQTNQTYYLADRSNAAVDVVDAKTGASSRKLPHRRHSRGSSSTAGRRQQQISGPDGVATDEIGKCLFAGDGPSRLVSFRFPAARRSAISTGGTSRADEMAFDPRDRLLLVVNNAETPPVCHHRPSYSVSPTCVLPALRRSVSPFPPTAPSSRRGNRRRNGSMCRSHRYPRAAARAAGALARINPLTASSTVCSRSRFARRMASPSARTRPF